MVVAEFEGFQDLPCSGRAGCHPPAELTVDPELHVTDRLERIQSRLGGQIHSRITQRKFNQKRNRGDKDVCLHAPDWMMPDGPHSQSGFQRTKATFHLVHVLVKLRLPVSSRFDRSGSNTCPRTSFPAEDSPGVRRISSFSSVSSRA